MDTPDSMTKPKSDYTIQTVRNALRVLEVFQDEEEIGVSDLSRRLGLHKNNAFRLLATLEEAGYIEQSVRSERYRLGASCLELGQAFISSNPLLRSARPVLEELSAELGESAHLGVLQGFEVVHLDGEQPAQLVLTASRVGDRLPVHCTALGKVLLGSGSDRLRGQFEEEVINERGLDRRTVSTITDRDKLFEHLNTVALQGYAVDLEECVQGMCCVAAPIIDGHGRVIAAISVSGPSFRLGPDELMGKAAPAVSTAADRISQHLGHPA
jgi:IclR family KDG regulon transcriptional repressor